MILMFLDVYCLESQNVLGLPEMNAVLIVGTFTAISLACSAQSPCDTELVVQTNPNDGDRYTQRDKDRCEGVYLQRVAGTVGNLLVASLSSAGGRLTQWPSTGKLTLRWNQFSGGPVHIQAFSLVPRKHFRLDVLSNGATSYDWNTNLAGKYLALSEAGVVAWTIAPVNGYNQRVYLPLSPVSGKAPKGPYALTIVPPVDLSELYLTVASIEPGAKALRMHAPLKYGSYRQDQKIDVDLPALPKTGLYRVELVGDRKDQGSVATPPFLVNHVQ
jgi:hypothetical protein